MFFLKLTHKEILHVIHIHIQNLYQLIVLYFPYLAVNYTHLILLALELFSKALEFDSIIPLIFVLRFHVVIVVLF